MLAGTAHTHLPLHRGNKRQTLGMRNYYVGRYKPRKETTEKDIPALREAVTSHDQAQIDEMVTSQGRHSLDVSKHDARNGQPHTFPPTQASTTTRNPGPETQERAGTNMEQGGAGKQQTFSKASPVERRPTQLLKSLLLVRFPRQGMLLGRDTRLPTAIRTRHRTESGCSQPVESRLPLAKDCMLARAAYPDSETGLPRDQQAYRVVRSSERACDLVPWQRRRRSLSHCKALAQSWSVCRVGILTGFPAKT